MTVADVLHKLIDGTHTEDDKADMHAAVRAEYGEPEPDTGEPADAAPATDEAPPDDA